MLPLLSASRKGNEMNWLPIETAPKDGTNILLLLHPQIVELTGYTVEVCHYQKRPLFGETWTAQNDGFSTEIAGATHWMPLPPPPGQSQEDGR